MYKTHSVMFVIILFFSTLLQKKLYRTLKLNSLRGTKTPKRQDWAPLSLLHGSPTFCMCQSGAGLRTFNIQSKLTTVNFPVLEVTTLGARESGCLQEVVAYRKNQQNKLKKSIYYLIYSINTFCLIMLESGKQTKLVPLTLFYFGFSKHLTRFVCLVHTLMKCV